MADLPAFDFSSIVNEKINWEGVVKAGGDKESNNVFVTTKDVEKLLTLKNPEELLSNLDKLDPSINLDRGKQVAKSIIKILKNVTDEKILAFALVLTSNLLSLDGKRACWFITDSGNVDINPFVAVARNSNEAIVFHTAVSSLSLLIANSVGNEAIVESFITTLTKELTIKGSLKIPSALNGLMILLSNKKLRPVVVKSNGLKALSPLLKTTSLKPQTVYQVMFCIWTISFLNDDATTAAFLKVGGEDIISGISLVLQNASKEKIIRVSISTLKNLLGRQGLNAEMIECKLLKFLITLSARTWSDTEILDDINVLVEGLHKDYQVFSSFDRYSKEIMSGKLEWGPVHTDSFWRDNVTKMEKDEFRLIRILVTLLDPKNASTVIAVALYDLGDFIRYYPNGKTIVKSFGGKIAIMSLLDHHNNEVKTQALMCCSKMMVNNWDFLDAANVSTKKD